MKSSATIFLRKDHQKPDGSYTIYLRVIINRKKKDHSLQISVPEKYWNEKKCEVKGSWTDSHRHNLRIKKSLKKAADILFDHEIKDKHLNIFEFDRLYNNNSNNSKSFYDFVEKQIDLNTGKFSAGTIRTYETQLSKLKKFRTNLEFGQIDIQFIQEYESYMAKTLKNNENTRTKSLKFLSQIINKAIAEGIVEENPFAKNNRKFKRIDGNREYLTLKEIDKLEKLLTSGELKKNKAGVLEYFLFSCYTGLRYSDINQLRYKHISDGKVSIVTEKTKKKVIIPIIKRPEKFLKDGPPEQPVFKVLKDQPTNRYLKEICSDANITKTISFHCSRHSFATNSLELGIPIEVVKSILGHSELRETLIYAKTTNKAIEEAMKKWE